MDTLKVLKLHPDSKFPTKKHKEDAGWDLYPYFDSTANLKADFYDLVSIEEHGVKIFHTGIAIVLPPGSVGLVWPKSRSNYLIGGGVIDSGYKGEILVKIINPLPERIWFGPEEAIAQLLIQSIIPTEKEALEISKEEFDSIESNRGATGGILSQLKSATFYSPLEEIE